LKAIIGRIGITEGNNISVAKSTISGGRPLYASVATAARHKILEKTLRSVDNHG
jgi:hypothetical protein